MPFLGAFCRDLLTPVGNTVAELVPGDDAAQALTAAAYDGVIEILTAALTRGQATGEITTTATPEAQAQLLLLLFQGSALVSRGKPESERFTAGIDAALNALRARLFPRVLRHRHPSGPSQPAGHRGPPRAHQGHSQSTDRTPPSLQG